MNRKHVMGVFAAMAVGIGSQVALAVKVTNLATNEVVFDSRGFEGDTAGTPPSATAAGNWVNYYTDTVVTGSPPGAFEGTQYAHTARDAGGAGGPEGHFSANQFFDGDQLHMEFALYLNPGADGGFFLHGASAYYRAIGRLTGGQFAYLDPSNSYIYSGMPYQTGKWQKWTIDYVVGAPTWKVGVDGASVTVPVYSGGGDVDGLYFNHFGDDHFWIDAVPEPGSLVLLGFGGMAFILRRRRLA